MRAFCRDEWCLVGVSCEIWMTCEGLIHRLGGSWKCVAIMLLPKKKCKQRAEKKNSIPFCSVRGWKMKREGVRVIHVQLYVLFSYVYSLYTNRLEVQFMRHFLLRLSFRYRAWWGVNGSAAYIKVKRNSLLRDNWADLTQQSASMLLSTHIGT